MIIARVLAFILGFAIVAVTLISLTRVLLVPRSTPDQLVRIVFLIVRFFFRPWAHVSRPYAERDRVMAFYAPLSLLALLPTWLTLILLAYTGMFWALGIPSWREAFRESGSSLFTLGFAPADNLPQTLLMFSEAAFGLILVALLIAYLPTMYAAFSKREAAVTLLEVRAGSPPSAVEMIERYHRIHGLENLSKVWPTWEAWFAEIEESHTSLPALVFFRSPQPDRSWVTAAGAVLDAAALTASTLDVPRDASADLCIRAGFIALRRVADYFHFPYNPDPHYPPDPISVTRVEFDAVYERLVSQGIPLRPDRDQAWRDWAGWRVNYDAVLLALTDLTMAPPAPWSSDRSQGRGKVKLKR
jgi:hypothetical protein